ncbi:MAG: 5-(carboxyamino)imidazole ribonucleotide mutase [Candidatus Omnitrophica bacterium]|nr:MAG: N5-carboxyaminoimidazole ribonucleotide mutase [Candidatus Hinthialibacteria bacterium OLB16]MCC6734369.1 5-(carboxyamino)imidazole ribonucleotide mutase [Candidatus Omnitrophota bacterium]
MGSPGDREQLEDAIRLLMEMEVDHEVHVLSAHRNPEKVRDYAAGAEQRGLQVLICAAGLAAHLAGAVAAQTTLPVIGIPIQGGALNGLDALLATVQMPRGTPVATMAIGKHGAINAALFALQILALQDPAIREKLHKRKEEAAR